MSNVRSADEAIRRLEEMEAQWSGKKADPSAEAKKQAAAEEEIRERMKTDKHLYFLPSDDFLGHEHIATSDGSHPTDLGFTYMLESIQPKILKILRKYGIKKY